MRIEFLPDEPPVDAPDESLFTPDRSPWRVGWVAFAALLAVGATLWALNRSSSVSSVSSGPSAPSHLAGPSSAVATRTDPECRGIPNCVVRDSVPPAVARLVRAYLPPGARLRGRTVTAVNSFRLRKEFVVREIDAFLDSVSVLIRVQRGGSATDAIAPDPPGVGSLLLHRLNSGYVVRLQYLAPDTVPPNLDRLRALIRDPRLISS